MDHEIEIEHVAPGIYVGRFDLWSEDVLTIGVETWQAETTFGATRLVQHADGHLYNANGRLLMKRISYPLLLETKPLSDSAVECKGVY